ncbi:MAG: hypothetical protein WCF84_10080 [Anaerolineae bacterium]
MTHPFEKIPPGAGRWFFVPALVLYLIIQAAFAWLDGPLHTAASSGVVSFELAGRVAVSRAMIDSWNDFARLDVSFGLGIDFLFMVAYSTLIGMACIWAARTLRTRRWPLAALGASLAWGIWLAVLCDSIENIMLLSQLFYGVFSPLPEIAAACATVKFLLIVLGLVYALYGAAAWLTRASRSPVRS